VQGKRTPEWFRTPDDFWTVLDHIDTAHYGTLHNPFAAAYLGLRVNEFAALQRGDVDLAQKRVHIRHKLDMKRRPSAVKSEESETWMPRHLDAATALRDALDHATDTTPDALVSAAPAAASSPPP
jgi:integrase